MKLEIERVKETQTPIIWSRMTVRWMSEVIEPSAQEHYLLLTYLAAQVTDGIILDLGTSTGMSALAFADGRAASQHDVEIITVDLTSEALALKIDDLVTVRNCSADEITTEWATCSLALLDIGHDGRVEELVFKNARENKFKGVMVVDDIRGCANLRELFRNLPERHYELSRHFHWSGTGIVDFGGDLVVTDHGRRLIPDGLK